MKSRTWMWTLLLWLFAALALPAQARVVYTPVNVTLPTNGYYQIDLNHDGITDFYFLTYSGRCPIGPGDLYFLRVAPHLEGGGIVGTSYEAAALQSGVQIDSSQSFYGGNSLMYQKVTGCGGGTHGQWLYAYRLYLGLKFLIAGQVHYGWAQLSTHAGGTNTLYGFAYETIPGMAIKTGQIFDSPDEPGVGPDSAESEHSGPTASVAPALSTAPELQSSGDTSGALPVGMAAQDGPSQDHKSKHRQYKLIDMGTFGGPNFFFNFSGSPDNLLNNRGTVTGGADTSIVDPYCFNNPDCFVLHAFKWEEGVATDLGALPGGSNSQAFGINAHGQIVGFAQNGMIDPLLGIQLIHAVLWNEGNIIDLGTCGGDESISQAINDQGQVIGYGTLNDKPDPFSFLGAQTHPFIWKEEVLHDLGTLGGPDAFAYLLNNSGQVAGVSFTNSTPNPVTGVPTQDPFLWENGNMQDLGTLGGVYGVANGLNKRGQVVGQSNLAGDLTFHPFPWTKSGGMQDLGTFGGDNGVAGALNDAGEIVGGADTSGNQSFHGVLWSYGKMTDLGFIAGCMGSGAGSINASGQIVGLSYGCGASNFLAAFLWEDGGPMVDLNTLVPPHPGIQLTGGDIYINDQGEILSSGTLQNGNVHAFLLIPCDEKHPGQCEDYSIIEVTAPQPGAPTRPNAATVKQDNETLASPVDRFRNMMRQRYHLPSQPAAPRD